MSLPVRLTLSALVLAGLSASVLPATAQNEGCTQASPCEWFVAVDPTGFVDSFPMNVTVGDWVVVNATGADDATHTITLEGQSVHLVVASDATVASAPFQANTVGAYHLVDSPSGAKLAFTVVNCSVVDYEDGLCDMNGSTGTPAPGGATGTTAVTEIPGKGRAPGIGIPLLAVALLGVVVLSARRQR